MKVRDLLEELKRYPADWDVVVARDEEGNGFNLSYDVSQGWYDSSEGSGCNAWSAEVLELETDTDELYRDRTPDECNSICIWP